MLSPFMKALASLAAAWAAGDTDVNALLKPLGLLLELLSCWRCCYPHAAIAAAAAPPWAAGYSSCIGLQ